MSTPPCGLSWTIRTVSEGGFRDMDAKSRQMVWTVSGTEGTAVVLAFAVPHMDNRIVITRDGSTEEQTLGNQTSYTYQRCSDEDATDWCGFRDRCRRLGCQC